jgi:hypothetical protein
MRQKDLVRRLIDMMPWWLRDGLPGARKDRLTGKLRWTAPAVFPASPPRSFSLREIRMDKDKLSGALSRREFGVLSAAALATPFVGVGSEEVPANSAAAQPQPNRKRAGGSKQGLNIVFVFGDQERYFAKWP